jgi:murein L,D-transpeptidase YafK
LISFGISRASLRHLLPAALLAASLGLTGCQTDGIDMAKAMRPLSSETLALIESKGMDKNSPILVRIFKEEAELEVWKQNRDGQFALLKTYPICRWSGELGPKMTQGDRQAPEGFYTITPGQMNPRSAYYLSFNLGYPNAFDRAHGRTGSHLMVHGDCSSAGCYSMTDDQIAEIYALGREAFFGGQKTFQVQAYPFHMTPLNMARHRNSPHFAFWKMLKQGNDHFEVSRAEPKVDVCEKRYVFDAQEPPGSTKPLRFDAAGRCPAYQVAPELAAEVDAKTRRDELAFADFVRRGTATVPTKMGQDGGMHPSFMAALNPQQVRDANGNVRWAVEAPPVGSHIRPVATASSDPRFNPQAAEPTAVASVQAPAVVPMPRPAPRRRAYASTASTTTAAYASSSSGASSGGVIDNLLSAPSRAASSIGRVFGFGQDEAKPAPKQTVATRQASTTRAARRAPAAKPAEPSTAQANAHPAPTRNADATTGLKRSVDDTAAPQPAAAASLLPGSQPVLPSNGFENRWPSTYR